MQIFYITILGITMSHPVLWLNYKRDISIIGPRLEKKDVFVGGEDAFYGIEKRCVGDSADTGNQKPGKEVDSSLVKYSR